MSLVFFDIDGTLLLSGGAGVRAMSRAFADVFGVADAFAGVSVAGRTDRWLLAEALRRAGLADSPDAHDRFRAAYLPILAEEIHSTGRGRYGVLPGVGALLAALGADARFHVALLTGNYQDAARIKLGHFGLASYFDWGAFGEEAADRDELGRIAMARARGRVPADVCARAVVIGDTPFDIACARAAGARAIAVATGSHTVDELAAAGADAALADLTATDRVLRLIADRQHA